MRRSRALSSKALKVLIPFHTTYLSEKVVSLIVYIKYNFRNRIENIESESRVKLSSIGCDIQNPVFGMHATLQIK